ncbi:B-cadherin-like isoform X2 [Phyllopteryx taeniolatus]|uniref:B-cadherin-like isoform X2 n=1 Tax=Phyllopteryx taeniolatus TaxID=161469 RepID=UPI002AD34C85|nr:B-cadherin-like isoform X2 [Phyllopteryx taeniolatus]
MEILFFLCQFLLAAGLHPCSRSTTTYSGMKPPASKHVQSFRRMKREWVIPDINVPENDRGPFPKFMIKIKSSNEERVAITYRVEGPGADRAPEGVFTVDRRSGVLYVTQPLDREKISRYVLMAHATVEGSKVEEPMELVINVLDQNDNTPECTGTPFYGNVSESAQIGESFMRITAVDKDAPNTDNADIRYRLNTQIPPSPKDKMFSINPVSGLISTMAEGLDRETQPKYKLIMEAADMAGEGLRTTCTAIISITDTNDHAPQFTFTSMSASTPENDVGREVLRLTVTDEDELGTPNGNTKYAIVKGNHGGHFSVETGPSKMEGILTTAKAVDFEREPVVTLLLVVTNDAPFSAPVSTSTSTVTVTVLDQNEPPIFTPTLIYRIISEGPPEGGPVADLRAEDPDTAKHQRVRYALHNDSARWLDIDKDTGSITVKGNMDRESPHVKDNKYTVLVLAYDNDTVPATGTGTLLVNLLDVNDHRPVIKQRKVRLCNREPSPTLLDLEDRDGPGHAGPFTVELHGEHRINWTVGINSTTHHCALPGHVAKLSPRRVLSPGDYQVVMRVYDADMLYQDSSVHVEVCPCQGDVINCFVPQESPQGLHHLPSLATSALGTIIGLLIVLLLLLLLVRRRRGRCDKDVHAALVEDVPRDNVFYYDDEGGGEDDQEYDLGQLHRGLDQRPAVFCTDVLPSVHSVHLNRRANDDVNKFIDEVCAADTDPTAPPYDSLLVFNYEGLGSQATSLSSIQSNDSDEEQDLVELDLWGPCFRRLADMYAGREDDDDLQTVPGKTEWV